MPAAVQRRPISPEVQCLTLRWVRRTMSIIDSHGFVDSSVRLSLPVIPQPDHGQRLLHPLAQRAGGAGVGAVELAGEPCVSCSSARVVVGLRATPGAAWP